MDLGSALLGIFAGLVVKGGVMVVGIWLVVKLGKALFPAHRAESWISIPEEDIPEAKVIFWGLVLFYVAETGCGLAILSVACPWAVVFDVIHSLLSGLGMSVFALGMYLYLDKKLLHYGDKRCLLNRICRGCTIDEDQGCKFHRFIALLILFVAMVALFTAWVPTDRVNLDPARMALPVDSWNEWYDRVMVPYFTVHIPGYEPGGKVFFLPTNILFLEFHVVPAMALLVLIAGVPYLVKRRDSVVLKLVIVAIGLLGYAYLEIVVYRGTNDALFGSVGHEMAELWFLITLAVFMRQTFPPAREKAGNVRGINQGVEKTV